MSNETSYRIPPFSETIGRVVAAALAEDIGPGDLTAQLLIPEQTQATMRIVARKPMVACGLFLLETVYRQLAEGIRIETLVSEGQLVSENAILATLQGPARALLTGERVMLNLLQRACGVATLTRRYVDAVKGTKAVILDTRKTMPGLRALDKYAVAAGGGKNHRMGLYDAVMIKDNHIATGIKGGGLGIRELIAQTRRKLSSLMPNPPSPIPVIIECDTLAQVEQALAAKPDRILLDNMDLETLQKAVMLTAGTVPLEASGGVSLESVRAIAETGVDYISIGRLTHSAPAADIGADIAF
ncbi:MAG: carboxylating nicotinate-nucleotide diphosphorylase [Pseudomonadota bacterium]|nr:carboxylating nicotinate-nucleotide diphosphorylase [Pseudomonadota bacterium]